MRKITNGTLACEILVTDTCTIRAAATCPYGRSTIAYAVERFLAHSPRFREECTSATWQVRLGGRRKGAARTFHYVIPAALMELPGSWVSLSGEIDPAGVKIRRVDLLTRYPRVSAR